MPLYPQSPYVNQTFLSQRPELIGSTYPIFKIFSGDISTFYKESEVEINFFKLLNKAHSHFPFRKKFSDQNISDLISYILDKLYFVGYDKIFIEPTKDDSILFTFRKGIDKVYLEYFIDFEQGELNECVITAFSDKKLLFNYAGTLNDCIKKSETFLNINNSENIQEPSLNVNFISQYTPTEEELQVY